ncbi:CmcJ/NvfI family oxidoreductase [Sphingomonas bacterium]|uniref:CmcJ/NvfI family oxidoreductase n=1 Tax=Sphingomonas bacterium TaxID=1895847 RepID=UPI0015757686|nr:CmcJ/NvfI family oxidoreductase [Sphingomonas bacterium]
MQVSHAVVELDGVQGDINYVRNPQPEGAEPLAFVTEDESRNTMITLPGIPMFIEDVRGQQTSLDREGFELVRHKSGVADFNLIEEDEAVDQLYIDEMAALAKELTGATFVVMQGGGKKRYGKKAVQHESGDLKNAFPALYPHGDTTDTSAYALASLFAGAIPGLELGSAKRWALINLWRPITPPPHDYPLAVCDARTTVPSDAVPVMAYTATRGGELVFETHGYLPNPDHRWCYFRDMTPDEVLVFKTHDSDPDRAHQVAHTAFFDATCPPDAPTRGSVEMRAFCVFD